MIGHKNRLTIHRTINLISRRKLHRTIHRIDLTRMNFFQVAAVTKGALNSANGAGDEWAAGSVITTPTLGLGTVFTNILGQFRHFL